jgi:hypothetical protein
LTVQTNRGKRSRICLKAYRFYLLGDEESLGSLGLSETEFQKMKEFHCKLEAGQSAYIIGRGMRLPEFVSKAMIGCMTIIKPVGKFVIFIMQTSTDRGLHGVTTLFFKE